MKKFLLALTCFLLQQFLWAQPSKPIKVAVFAPIYIDSAFTNNNYKLGNASLPKNILPGLEFYNGVMMALDSLQAEKLQLEVLVFDSKSKDQPISKVLANPVWDSVSLIIASFNNRVDIKPLADFAATKSIPLISATFPNDGGVENNPFFILINSTLRTHIEALYKYLQKNYSTGHMVYVRKKGAVEDMIQNTFLAMAKATPLLPLKYKTIELTDSFTNKQLLAALDSTKQNIVVCGSINEAFGSRLLKVLSTNRNYPSTAIGMPTWDGLKEINKTAAPDTKGIDIVYSSPFNFSRTEKLGLYISNKYRNKYFARPSDWVFKGFESMYHYTKLLVKNGDTFLNHLSDKDFKLFTDFDIQPVKLKKDNPGPDYLENKKLYFIKKQDGVVKSVQ
jgi:ABC-type branched-subunit amino acid transport system substrate-binding protein